MPVLDLNRYDHDNIKQLAKWGINVIKPNYRAEQYMQDLTRLISENIDACSELFCIPKYTKKDVLKKEFEKYMANIDKYPFQTYIHWIPVDAGSILYSDGKFLSVIYKQHTTSTITRNIVMHTAKRRIISMIL